MGERFEVASEVYDEFMYDLGYLDFIKKEMGRKLIDSIFTTLKAGEKIVKLSDYEYLQNTPELRTEIRQHIDITDLVRCRECKYWRQQTNYAGLPLSFGFCESDDMWRSLYGETYEVAHINTDDNHYCGYAKRRE